jgi:hypothetical protein
VKKQRSSRHPSKNHWLVGGFSPKNERSYVSRSQALWSLQQVVKIDPEGEMQAQPLWPRPHLPQTEHGIASTPYPVERDPSLAKDLSKFQSHAYRRGLASNRKELGIDDLVIQRILRHGDVGTIQKSYILRYAT